MENKYSKKYVIETGMGLQDVDHLKNSSYFTDEAKTEVYDKFCKSLRTGGILFIGSTEQVIDYKELGYKRRYSFYYEKV